MNRHDHVARSLILAVAGCALMASACRAAPPRQVSISKTVNGSPLTVAVHPDRYAGAINSLTFRGVEYVDNYDHGRQIQSALQVDGLGECFNPTEAGSKGDAARPRTTSRLVTISSDNNRLTTATRAAFWLSPGENYGRSCSLLSNEQRAQNRVPLSDFLISKSVSFSDTIPNLLSFDIGFRFPEARRSASIEALTAYMPPAFNSFYSYNSTTQTLTTLRTGGSGAMTMQPVIIATADGRSAMGVISPDIARRDHNQAYYAYFYFDRPGAAAKWSCVFNEAQIAAGATLRYRCPIAVGTLDEVVRAFDSYAKGQRLAPNRARSLSLKRIGSTSVRFGGAPFKPFQSGAPDRGALFACDVVGTADRFVSTRMDCEGMRPAGQIGFARREAAPGLVPLLRFYRASSNQHLITVRPQEGTANGFLQEGVLGYVSP